MAVLIRFSVIIFSKLLFGLSSALVLLGSPAAPALEASRPAVVSRSVLGGPAAGPCVLPYLSSNARYVVFTCQSRDLVFGDDNDRSDTIWVDRYTDEVRRVSLNAANAEQRNHSGIGFPSADGGHVAFSAEGLFHPDVVWVPPGSADASTPNVFLRTFAPPSTELLGRHLNGEGNPELRGASLSHANADRHEVLFSSRGNYVGAAGELPANVSEIFLRNWHSGAVERISARPDGGKSASDALIGSISANGRYVVFLSQASDITTDNPLGFNQLFLRDRQTGTTRRLTRPWSGGEFSPSPPFNVGPNYSIRPRLSQTGALVLFSAGLNDEFTPDDNIGFSDVYLLDVGTGQTELISKGFNGAQTNGSSTSLAMSADARFVAFFSRASNITGVSNPYSAIYVKDRTTGEIVNVTASLGRTNPSPFVPHIDMSPDGHTLVFSWRGDDPAYPDVFGRVLIYSVALTGNGLAPTAVPVPAASPVVSVGMAVLIGSLGAMVLAYRRRHPVKGTV